ncbi:MAG: glycosyltransferase family 87 protein [bacterium]|nr:glycosyltransferase family 87 protein [bacterium]
MTPPVERPIRNTLNRLEKALLFLLLMTVIAFGGITLMRSALMSHRHTDAGVYFRAAWAIQHNQDIYRIIDDNGWHYHYPPTLATLLIPLSDPPHDKQSESGWKTPYPLAIAIWYVASFLAFCLGLHLLAGTLESVARRPAFRNPPPFSRIWWALRTWPLAICIVPIGSSLGRGQVTPFVFLFLCAMIREWSRNRSGRAGLWLAAAVCIKVFPVFLLVAPLFRRDWTFLIGFAAGMLVGLVLVPALAIGFPTTLDLLSTYWDVFSSELIRRVDGIRSRELFNDAEGDLMSFRAVILRTYLYFKADGLKSNPQLLSAVHVGISGLVTLATLRAASSFGAANSGLDRVLLALLVGTLTIAALAMVPTAQPHYFMLSAILITVLIFAQWERTGVVELSFGWIALFAAFGLLSAVSLLPRFEAMMKFGGPVYAGLLLWIGGVAEMRSINAMTGRLPGGATATGEGSAIVTKHATGSTDDR